ncbi:MAG: MBOAT family protein [Chloroflexota bacterium]|nr:MAG: MBOAT family protein [Chloroflexota bacterium]
MTLVLIGGMALCALIAPLLGTLRLPLLLLASIIFLILLQWEVAPSLWLPLAAIALSVGTWWLTAQDSPARRRMALLLMLYIIGIFAVLKLPALQGVGADALNIGQSFAWIGFSYLAFRLVHVLLDFRSGRLKPLPLPHFVLYAIFFPALAAGPIARIEQFEKALAAPLSSDRFRQGALRLMRGLLKKFVLADSLALMALSPQLASDALTGTLSGTLVLWLMLYAYAFRLFLDFSGYTDIAIGIGLWAGIKLPENFEAPYLKRNLQAFWNSWHMTLSAWFRAYFFMPASRGLLRTPLKAWREGVVLGAQLGTMILIGLWHGATLNYVLWGAWHGIGLWLFRQWSARAASWDAFVRARPLLARLMDILSVLTTFHYVALGWIFFALPEPELISKVWLGLIGR